VSDLTLTDGTKKRIALLFHPNEHPLADRLLREECGRNLPSMANASGSDLERIHFAALKVSDGNMKSLRLAIRLAQIDWRDLLVNAGFELDPLTHKDWLPSPRSTK
jgi:hypothetical protein